MHPGLSEVAAEVEAEPGAVLDEQGADSVDDLVGDAADSDPGDDAAVAGFFEGGLATPERSRGPDRSSEPDDDHHADTGREPLADEPAAPSEIMADLEGAIAAESGAPEPEYDARELAAEVEDDEVADALADAEELEAHGDEAASLDEFVFE